MNLAFSSRLEKSSHWERTVDVAAFSQRGEA